MEQTQDEKEQQHWLGYFNCKAKPEESKPVAFVKGNPWLSPKKDVAKVLEVVV